MNYLSIVLPVFQGLLLLTLGALLSAATTPPGLIDQGEAVQHSDRISITSAPEPDNLEPEGESPAIQDEFRSSPASLDTNGDKAPQLTNEKPPLGPLAQWSQSLLSPGAVNSSDQRPVQWPAGPIADLSLLQLNQSKINSTNCCFFLTSRSNHKVLTKKFFQFWTRNGKTRQVGGESRYI